MNIFHLKFVVLITSKKFINYLGFDLVQFGFGITEPNLTRIISALVRFVPSDFVVLLDSFSTVRIGSVRCDWSVFEFDITPITQN